MDFLPWLYRSGYVCRGSFARLVLGQFGIRQIGNDEEDRKTASRHFGNTALSEIRPIPGGDLLKNFMNGRFLSEVLGLAQLETLDELVLQWQQWHLDNLEPICDYALDSSFSKSLYSQQAEKKTVASFLCNEHCDEGRTLLRSTDSIIVPEGSSCLYAALAVARDLKSAKIITTNQCISREFLQNPAIRRGLVDNLLTGVHAIGGMVDADFCATCSEHSQDQIRDEIRDGIPATTVVISSCVGISKSDGPCAPDNKSASTRLSIILEAIERVRSIIFIADYTKHLTKSNPSLLDHPIFTNGDNWKNILKKYGERISIVTCPPPEIASYLAKNPSVKLETRDLAFDEALGRGIAGEYERNVQELASMCKVYEASGPSVNELTSTTS